MTGVAVVDGFPGATIPEYALVAAGYAILLGTSGIVVRSILRWSGADAGTIERERDTGTAIGKIENVLVLTLTLAGAYTALGIVFAAKSIVRRADMDRRDTTYYLTGTLANFTYSLLVGTVLLALLDLV